MALIPLKICKVDLTGSINNNQISGRIARLKLSFAQDIVYAVTEGKIKTPKSILLSSTIKTLTNNTELINIVNRLGHGISYSILNELTTENAFKIQEEQFDGKCILPVGFQKNMFTIYVT